MSIKIRLTKTLSYDLTFETLLLCIEKQSMQDARDASMPKQALESSFRNLFRGAFYNGRAENVYMKKCFADSRFDFLTSPLSEKKTGLYYTEPETCKCLLARMAFDPAQVYEFFYHVERVFRQYEEVNREGIQALLRYFDAEYMEKKCGEMKSEYAKIYDKPEDAKEDPCTEYTELSGYWAYYLRAAQQYHIYLAVSLLILFSVFNAGVIHLLPAIRKYFLVSGQPVRNQRDIISGSYVIRSALSDTLYLAHMDTSEILSEDDHTNATRTMLFTTHRYQMNQDNAIFSFEEADPRDDLPDPEAEPEEENTELASRQVEIVGKPLDEVARMIASIGKISAPKERIRRRETRYYIKAVCNGEAYYMRYDNWFKNSKILFEKEKTNKSVWYIEAQPDGSFKISPSGSLYYNLFTLDIPNAITQTDRIPLWLFPGTSSKAQRFLLYKVIPFKEEHK